MSNLNRPSAVFVSNDEVFIADTGNDRVRKLLRNGQIVTIAGNERGSLYDPSSIVVSSSNQVYISEGERNLIFKIDEFGIISKIAGTYETEYNGDDQLAVNTKLNSPCGLFITDNDEVLFCDKRNHRVRKIDRNGIIRTIAGNGIMTYNGDNQLATLASLRYPSSVFQYKDEIYIADSFSNRIRKIDRNGIIHTIAGNGIEGYNGDRRNATDTSLNNPDSLFVHNDEIYFSDLDNHVIRKILPNGIIKNIAGIPGKKGYNGDFKLATRTKLCWPTGIFVDSKNQVYFADHYNHCVRKIFKNGNMKIIAGIGDVLGYEGDVPFDFQQYPHIGPPRKKSPIKPFPKSYHDLILICQIV
ncbi:predicted protein [Naegleria gruberi]|uniref:Predicted protein n=1 Tax=Naegleria gruberi TaxID=5762 RepID=D2W591_NAEGR|nr:uncharacterized protein NAEGRDRAFT_76579 [Naegleria gruberi]EFC35761.1 predicted protein [Naegleria gruberi]|eukprot:XP_002668505.1 predicted protein [Naegleria gruberi strain NEG-M]